MIKWIKVNKTLILGFISISASIPIFIVASEILFKGKDAVHFTIDSTTGLIVILYYLILILAGIAFSLRWLIRQIMVIRRLKIEKTKAELLHLKAQVNPHFFFNMLNNIYGWIDKNPSTAKELVLKLSELMRYSIYDGQKDRVGINEEISFLKNYIELHQIRYRKDINVEFASEIKDNSIKVMPLLFVILVENAFKHGVETLRKNANVNILLHTNDKEIIFKVENNFDETIQTKEGIGLQNLERRLSIMYPNKYKLSTSSSNNIFTALLNLTVL